MLSDDAINAIAHEVRTKPLSDVGRHVMPLIAHITELDGRLCQGCRHWLAYNMAGDAAARGECLLYATGENAPTAEDSPVRVVAIGQVEAVALLVPFDWSCKGWQARPEPPKEERAMARLF